MAATLNARAFYVGCHPAITDEEVEYMIETFHGFFAGSR